MLARSLCCRFSAFDCQFVVPLTRRSVVFFTMLSFLLSQFLLPSRTQCSLMTCHKVVPCHCSRTLAAALPHV